MYILLFNTKGEIWNFDLWGEWYTAINANLIIHYFPIMHISGRNFKCCSIMTILLTFVIGIWLIIWSLWWSAIIIGRTWCLTRMPITFALISLERCDWWSKNINSKEIKVLKTEKKIKCMIFILIGVLLTCLWDNNVFINWWKFSIKRRRCTNNFNLIIFHWWFLKCLLLLF